MFNLKEYKKQYRKDNKDKIAKYYEQWRKENPEKLATNQKKYSKTEKGKIAHRKTTKQWLENNPEYDKKYHQEHKEHYKELIKIFFKTAKGKLCRQRNRAKRRVLGFEPLNNFFEGSEGHHINKNDVIYIPKEIHQSINHCLETGKNMMEINKLAMNLIILP